MKATHLTDEEIQQYVLDRDAADAAITSHIHSCGKCQEKAETYRRLFSGLREQPNESFDFAVTELVMHQLPVPARVEKAQKGNGLIYGFITVVAAIVGFSLYFFRKYMTSIFESIAPLFIYLVLTAFMTLSIFLIADIYKKYKKKIHALDLYQG